MAKHLMARGLLLQQISVNGGVAPLQRMGLQFSQIAHLIEEAREHGLISLDELKLTLDGEKALDAYRAVRQRSGSGGWIAPASQYRVERVSQYSVFLPVEAPDHPLRGE
jgi:hypothetical protein